MKEILFYNLLFTLILTSCSGQISKFVTDASRPTPPKSNDTPSSPPKAPPSTSTPNPYGYKFSSAANVVAGTNIKSKFSLSVNERIATGTNVKSKFTFHQNRPQ